MVAFYAIISHNMHGLGAHQTIIFDVAKTNIGSAYSPHTGVFTAPSAGVYVFTWSIRLVRAEHSFEIIVNAEVYGATFLRAKTTAGGDETVTGTVVVHLSTGDEVFVRTHAYVGDGDIYSNTHGQPTFSGWKLN